MDADVVVDDELDEVVEVDVVVDDELEEVVEIDVVVDDVLVEVVLVVLVISVRTDEYEFEESVVVFVCDVNQNEIRMANIKPAERHPSIKP